MAEIQIISFGHACFKIVYKGQSVVFDPYQDESVPGLKLPRNIQADAVYCSHEHADHNASFLVESKNTDPYPYSLITVPHDDCNGKKRGLSNITIIQCGNVKIAHMGDIGRIPTKKEYAQLDGVDVVLIPVGGFYTIDARAAKEIVDTLQNPLTVCMHYRDGAIGYDVLEDISSLQNIFAELERYDECFFAFDENKVPRKVITLKAKQ